MSQLAKFRGVAESSAWEEGKGPMIRFRLDDGRVIGMMFHHATMTAEYPDENTLTIFGPPGGFVIEGPRVADLHHRFAAAAVSYVKADGKDITSVTLMKRGGGEDDEEKED
jgi:hypothetical protein